MPVRPTFSWGDPRPVNAQNALDYLDKIKDEVNHPDDYSQFLAIMQDFKRQRIDTLGVIKRVAALFQGYPALINGFNVFLPVGYNIECSSETDDVTVNTPEGATVIRRTR